METTFIPKKDRVLILDFGSQYTQLIARRVREQNVYCEIYPYNVSFEKIIQFKPSGLIFSGGPSSVQSENSPFLSYNLNDLNIPVLGICYGMQLIVKESGGEVASADHKEYGPAVIEFDKESELFDGLDEYIDLKVWMSHGDKVNKIPDNYKVIAKSSNSPFAAICNSVLNRFGVQFHPEVVHTKQGHIILKNFLFNICKVEPLWNMHSFIESTISRVKKQTSGKKVICGLSGGVDSSVTAVLLNKAIGKDLTCIFVDNGLLRKDERKTVEDMFTGNLGINLIVVDASDSFLEKLKGITDPEKKRKIIGHLFIEVFEKEANKIKDANFLAQGTLYPDVIESVSAKGPSATIKSHHNVGGLPERMNLSLIEPLRELFKDEVRALGEELEMPNNIVERQPFPGPGLAVRIVGEITERRLSILREADAIVREEIKKASLDKEIWQFFAVLLPVKSVGVMGDFRTYDYTIAVRAVTSTDGMTADWARIPYDILATMSSRIINEVKGVNRVLYDISQKPPSTIEYE